jgi:hypothetical protein
MTILVTDQGFGPDTWDRGYTPLGEAANDAVALDVPADTDPDKVPLTAQIIRVDFPSFADGRGFTIARMLRLRGYQGRLRAHGHVISDQYAMASPKISGSSGLIGRTMTIRPGCVGSQITNPSSRSGSGTRYSPAPHSDPDQGGAFCAALCHPRKPLSKWSSAGVNLG